MLDETFTLNNGNKIPQVGYGTWLIDDSAVENAVKYAIEVGYRHIDTAQAYGNEAGVGRGIRASKIGREKIFVTDKVAAEAKTFEAAYASIDESLGKLGLDYIDLMIIHAPQPWAEFRQEKRYFAENREVWRALETAHEEGKVKAIGVSNFLKDDLENILEHCQIQPAVNQILAHAGQMDWEVIEFCRKHDILVEAYSPIAHGAALKRVELKDLAVKYQVSVAQLCIKFILQLEMVALPKASSPEHILQNSKLDFTIKNDDMELLKHLAPLEDYGEDSFFPVFKTVMEE